MSLRLLTATWRNKITQVTIHVGYKCHHDSPIVITSFIPRRPKLLKAGLETVMVERMPVPSWN